MAHNYVCLALVGLGAGAAVHNITRHRIDVVKLHVDTMGARSIMIKADPEWNAYIIKEHEHAVIVRDFMAQSKLAVDDYAAMKRVTDRVRASPFFNEWYRPEYTALGMLILREQPSVERSALVAAFPKLKDQFDLSFPACKDVVTIRDAADAMERKLCD